MSKLAIELSPDGQIRDLDITDNNASLKILQGAVSGLIQPVGITDNLVMWVNEEFVFMPELELNALASSMFESIGGNYAIHGTVVFTGGLDEDGYSDGLDRSTRDKLYALSGALKSMISEFGFTK